MIVIDSSVWIDHLNEVDTPQVEEMRSLIVEDVLLCVTGVIVTEVLRGISNEADAAIVGHELSAFPVLSMDTARDYAEAAGLYRRARAVGVTIRSLADLLIAVPCIREEAWLLHNDRDFDQLAAVSDLKIWEPRD